MLQLCEDAREYGFRHFFYGGAEGVADKLAERLTGLFPGLQVAGTYCPPFRKLSEDEQDDVAAKINATQPDIVWVGLGAPKQEKWMAEQVRRIKAPAMIGVGAAFDFHSGNVQWAPRFVRRCGIVWAYRLAVEPRRMWRRRPQPPRHSRDAPRRRRRAGGRTRVEGCRRL
jgi:N-acetylglucosaminyldiphosphoundecaprenol N-acetyl-beta-D-mannosaminyltransferase